MGYLLSRKLGGKCLKSNFVFSIFNYIDCNKRGQTSRLVAGAQIQTSCNFKTVIGFWILSIVAASSFFLESYYMFIFSVHRYSSVPIHPNLCLHKNCLHSASQSSSC